MSEEKRMRDPTWNEDLMCNWYGLLVHEPDTVLLLIKPLNCTDMEGAIKVAKAVMPDVSTVIVAAAGTGEVDVVYQLKDDEWEAGTPPSGAVLKEALAVGVAVVP